jgi:hypothetical protein
VAERSSRPSQRFGNETACLIAIISINVLVILSLTQPWSKLQVATDSRDEYRSLSVTATSHAASIMVHTLGIQAALRASDEVLVLIVSLVLVGLGAGSLLNIMSSPKISLVALSAGSVLLTTLATFVIPSLGSTTQLSVSVVMDATHVTYLVLGLALVSLVLAVVLRPNTATICPPRLNSTPPTTG